MCLLDCYLLLQVVEAFRNSDIDTLELLHTHFGQQALMEQV